jgi:alpha-amylase
MHSQSIYKTTILSRQKLQATSRIIILTMKTSFFFLAALQFAARVFSADKAAWKSRNIYFALTDRVARNNNDNGGNGCGNLGNYCGGTFAGIQSKLDYIQGMGFDAIWLTPVVASEYPSH